MFGKSWKQLEIYKSLKSLKNFKKWNPPEKNFENSENWVLKEFNSPTWLWTEILVHSI